MIKGIGVDIVEISRIKDAVKKYGDRFLEKIFTDKELEYCQAHKAIRFPELAVRFAAKEAYSKANGSGIVADLSWKNIEIINDEKGKPHISLNGKLAKNVQVSLSHELNSAIAFVVIN
ncbi:MAG: holo-ACP synthase [Candidatus Saganbacteria bacterium]|nr:holo-ACP synthase [Candidatus Saganbacteria bacterium]